MKRIRSDVLALLFLIILTTVFFLRLFYPTSSLFMIPDFGHSDVLHFNLPLKDYLSTSLKNHQWPLWTNLIGNGFPLLAEGQIGTFYLPNLILYRFLPTILAYNLNSTITFFISALGTYILLRYLRLSSKSSLIGSIIFAFSGYFSLQLNHIDLIQTASLFPFLLWSSIRLVKKPKMRNAILFAFILSQQIFAGHINIVFISLLGVAILCLYIGITKKRQISFVRVITYIIIAVILTILLASIQLLPTYELWKTSARAGGLDFETTTQYPFPWKHLLSFWNPYAFGNPADGSYPQFSSNWGIFWENTPYVGKITLLLIFVSLLPFGNVKKRLGFVIILGISLLLVLGKYSPLYFLFSLPPFNFFRVPSRYLLLTVLSLSILASYGAEIFLKKSNNFIVRMSLFLFILGCILLDEVIFSYRYPPVTPSSYWTTPPKLIESLPTKKERIITFGLGQKWNAVFIPHGWNNIEPYVYFKNGLDANYNIVFSVPHSDFYMGGLVPRRLALWNSLEHLVSFDDQNNIATLSAITRSTISSSSVQYIISTYQLPQFAQSQITQIIPLPNLKTLTPFYVYKNEDALPRYYLSFQSKKVDTVEDITSELSNRSIFENKTTLVEDNTVPIASTNANGDISLISTTSVETYLKTHSNKKGILVIGETYYPGWKATIDRKPTTIFPVNLSQRGIMLPAGDHRVRFWFEPDSFRLGKYITVITWIGISLGIFFNRRKL